MPHFHWMPREPGIFEFEAAGPLWKRKRRVADRKHRMALRGESAPPFLPARGEIDAARKIGRDPSRDVSRVRIFRYEPPSSLRNTLPGKLPHPEVAGHIREEPLPFPVFQQAPGVRPHLKMHQVVGALAA